MLYDKLNLSNKSRRAPARIGDCFGFAILCWTRFTRGILCYKTTSRRFYGMQ